VDTRGRKRGLRVVSERIGKASGEMRGGPTVMKFGGTSVGDADALRRLA
jgi:hypothetical protein